MRFCVYMISRFTGGGKFEVMIKPDIQENVRFYNYFSMGLLFRTSVE